MYSKQAVSQATFKDPYFKEMLSSMGSYVGDRAPILAAYLLKMYIEVDFAIFLVFLRLICHLKARQSHGSPSAQFVHDGATGGGN